MEAWQQELLACPFDRAKLWDEGEHLRCSRCQRIFPIIEGIPSFVIPELARAHETAEWRWKRSEMKARDEQAVFYDRLLGLLVLTPFEVPLTLRALRGDRKEFSIVAEIGCGTGRVLQHFMVLAERVVGADLSLMSLKRCRERLRRKGLFSDVFLVHADACFLPFQDAVFDGVASCQMIEHVPSDRMRRKVIAEIARTLRPEGRFVVSGYHWSWLTRWVGPKEGVHKGGIYYFRFTAPEFLSLFPPDLFVERIRTIFGYAWLAAGKKLS